MLYHALFLWYEAVLDDGFIISEERLENGAAHECRKRGLYSRCRKRGSY